MTSHDDNLPVIGVSMGDPTGIGAEVVVKALADPSLHETARFVVYGRNELLTLAADRAGIRPYWFRVAQGSDRARGSLLPPVTVVDFHEIDFTPPLEAGPGRTGGHLSKQFVEEAIADALLTGVAQAGSSCRSLLLPGLAEPSGTTCTNSRVSVQRRWSLSGDASAVADVHDRLALVVPQHATHPQASAALRDAADRCSNEAARLLSEATAPSGGDVMSPQGTPLNGVALALGLWSCALHLHKGHGTTLNNLGILARRARRKLRRRGNR